MARYTLVANSSLCPGNSTAFRKYYALVDVFVDKYNGEGGGNTLTIPNGHGKLEDYAVDEDVNTMRLDLQGTESGYANFQAQFGTGHENCKKGGSMGGILMCCGVPFTKAEMKEGLRRSFSADGSFLCKLDPDGDVEVKEKVKQSKVPTKTKPGKKPWQPGDVFG